jgi:D-lactate dehydrogenase
LGKEGLASFSQILSVNTGMAQKLLGYLSRRLRAETYTVARLLSGDVDNRLKVAVFDTKPYTRQSFLANNHDEFALHFFEPRLSSDTVNLASGFEVVCVFVNDNLDAQVAALLKERGVGHVALRCAGYNNVDVAEASRLGISVTRVPAYSPYSVAEHAVALILTLNRKIHKAYGRVREGNFSLAGLVGFDLHGKTAGVVGVGKIGKCLVEILRGFGMRVIGFDRNQDAAFAQRTGFTYVELDELYASSEVISLHAPLLPSTKHMIDATAIGKMKPGVFIINTGRGGLVDTGALIEGLKSGKVGAAGLDVYEEEDAVFFEDRSDQVMTDDLLARLLSFSNVVVTSHQAFLTAEALSNIAQITLENIAEYKSGKRLKELSNAVVP